MMCLSAPKAKLVHRLAKFHHIRMGQRLELVMIPRANPLGEKVVVSSVVLSIFERFAQ